MKVAQLDSNASKVNLGTKLANFGNGLAQLKLIIKNDENT